MSARGWWTLTIDMWDSDNPERVVEPNDYDLEHICEVIAGGCKSGELIQD